MTVKSEKSRGETAFFFGGAAAVIAGIGAFAVEAVTAESETGAVGLPLLVLGAALVGVSAIKKSLHQGDVAELARMSAVHHEALVATTNTSTPQA